MKTRGQKALINTLILATYQLATFVCGLILPRYILTYFGSDYNGISSSINQFVGFISILQIGIAGSTRFALYRVLADNDTTGLSGIINATERYMRKVGLVLLAYIGLLMIVYPYMVTTDLPIAEVRWLVVILGASTFAQYFFGVTYQILLTADQRQYIYYVIITAATIANVVIAVLLMKAGQNIFIVKAGSSLIFALVPIILSILVRQRYQIDKKIKPNKVGLKGRWDVMWHSVANIIHDNTDLLVLTLLTTAKQVSVYTVYYLVVNGIYKVLSIFTSSLEAAFGNMFAKREFRTAYNNLELYEFFMCSFVSVVFSCALILIIPFVQLYTAGVHDVNYVEPVFAAVALVAQLVMCLRQPYLTVVQAAGHYRQTRNGAFVEAGLNLLISVVLTIKIGIVGVAIGTLAANIFRTLQYMFYLRNNILERSVKKPLLMLAWTFVNVGIVIAICRPILMCCSINAWWQWIALGAVFAVIALLVTLLSAFICFRDKLIKTILVLMKLLMRKKQMN